MVVFFEGVDKSGKTTLKDRFNKFTNYKHLVFDRGPLSSLVYDKIYKRSQSQRDAYGMLFGLYDRKVKCLVVLCEASNDDIRKRLNNVNEKLDEYIEDINKVKSKFEEQAMLLKDIEMIDYIILDTSEYSIDQCVGMIVDKIARM